MAAHYARQSVRSQSLSSAVMMTHDNCCIQMQSMLGENSQNEEAGHARLAATTLIMHEGADRRV